MKSNKSESETRGTMRWKPILARGRNCWSTAAVDAAGLLIDARSYYRAFYHVARQAKRYILIAGWRFNSDVRLLRGKDAKEADGEVKFLPFLNQLCDQNPELRIYVLAWDFSIIFVHEWELFQEWRFQRKSDKRLQFRFDDQHAIGASHHQKFVVVDGRLAFAGGLDFNADDWDDRRHLAYHPDRHDSGQEHHAPYHDVQAYVSGAAAEELAVYFRRRWQAAGGDNLELPPPAPDSLPAVKPSVAISAGEVAISRTEAKTLSDPTSVREIRQLYLDAIDAAEELIYIENQYFSSQAVCQALVDRMRAPGRSHLEIVLVLPKQCNSWVESMSVGGPRLQILNTLRETAEETGHRLGVYYPAAAGDGGPEVVVVLHSKVLIVDDRFLTAGSCNTSNRSMGLDTELNLSWEATTPENHDLIRSIRRVRVSLLAEHCGLRHHPEARRKLAKRRGLVAYLNRLADKRFCRLRHLTREAMLEDRQWLKQLETLGFALDPEKPVIEEQLYETIMPDSDSLLARGLVWFRDWLKNPAKP
jgi:phospholipase D1/2